MPPSTYHEGLQSRSCRHPRAGQSLQSHLCASGSLSSHLLRGLKTDISGLPSARSPCSVLRGARHPQRLTCSHVAVDFEGLRPRGLHLEDAAALLPGQEELLAVLWELCKKKEKVSEKTSPCPLSPSCCQHDPSRRSPRQEPTSCAHLQLWCWMCAGAGGPWVPSISTPVTQYLPIYPNAAIWAPIQGRSWASGQAAAAQG